MCYAPHGIASVGPGVGFAVVEETSLAPAGPFLGTPTALAADLDFDPLNLAAAAKSGSAVFVESSVATTVENVLSSPHVAQTAPSNRGSLRRVGLVARRVALYCWTMYERTKMEQAAEAHPQLTTRLQTAAAALIDLKEEIKHRP